MGGLPLFSAGVPNNPGALAVAFDQYKLAVEMWDRARASPSDCKLLSRDHKYGVDCRYLERRKLRSISCTNFFRRNYAMVDINTELHKSYRR